MSKRPLSTLLRGASAIALSLAGLTAFAGVASATVTVPPVTNATASNVTNTAAPTTLVTVSWLNPASTGVAVTGYEVTDGSGNVLATVTGGGASGAANSVSFTPSAAIGTTLDVYALNGSTQSAADAVSLTTPAAPTITGVTAGNGTLSVAFSGGATTGLLTTDGYVVYYNGTQVATGTTSPISVSDSALGLPLGTLVAFTAKAVNPAGSSSASAASTPVATAATPSAPTGVTATADYVHGTVTVSWTAPTSTGGSALSYVVSTTNDGNPVTCTTSTATSCTFVLAAYNGTYTVTATNSGNLSSTGVSNNLITVSVPSAPTSSSLTGSYVLTAPSTTATLTLPPFPGGVIGAIVQGEVCTAAATPATNCQASGSPVFVSTSAGTVTLPVTIGASYFNASVQYVSSTGTSSATQASATSLADAATAPANVSPAPTVTSTNSTLTATWTAPASNGSAITGYTVELLAGGTLSTTVTTTGLTYTFTGLTAGTSYTVEVKATNAIGSSAAFSAPSTANTLNAAPAGVTFAYTATGITVSWTAETGVTSFTAVDAHTGAVLCTATGSATSCNVPASALVAGDYVAVYSTDASGISTAETSSLSALSKPTGTITVATPYYNSTVGEYVSWSGASNATSYTILGTDAATGGIITATSTSAHYTFPASVFSTAQPASAFTFQVEAVNALGAQASYSAASGAAAAASEPTWGTSTGGLSAAAVAASRGSSVTVSWTAATAGSTAITSYTVSDTLASGQVLTCTSTTTSCTFTGLAVPSANSFTVVANDAFGSSAATSAVTDYNVGTSGAVEGLTVVQDHTTATTAVVTFTVPYVHTTWVNQNNGYTLTYTDTTAGTAGTSVPCATPATSTTYTCSVASLAAGDTYTFSVVSNGTLLGGVAATSPATTATYTVGNAPAAPAAPTAAVTASTTAGSGQFVTVNWTAPASNGSAITGYIVTAAGDTMVVNACANSSDTSVTNTGSTVTIVGTATSVECQFTGVPAPVTFTVTAVNAFDPNGTGGNASAASTAVTPVDVPAQLSPTSTALSYSSTGGYLFVWAPVTGATGYTVTVAGGSVPSQTTTTNTYFNLPASSVVAGESYVFYVAPTNAGGSGLSQGANGTLIPRMSNNGGSTVTALQAAGAQADLAATPPLHASTDQQILAGYFTQMNSLVPATPTSGQAFAVNNSSNVETTVNLAWAADTTLTDTTADLFPVTYQVTGTVGGVTTVLGSPTTNSFSTPYIAGETFSVTASNINGASAALSVFTPVAAQQVPAAPNTLSIGSVTTTGFVATWTAGYTNGSNSTTVPVTGYTVTVTSPSGAVVTKSVTTATATITGLSAGTTYSVAVTETDAYGTSTAVTGYTTTSLTALAPATAVTEVAAGPTSITVSWTDSVSGSAVTTYVVSVLDTDNAGAATYCTSVLTATSTSCNITGLTGGDHYTAKVTAYGAGFVSVSADSATTAAGVSVHLAAPAAIAAVVTAVTLTYPAYGSLGVSWTAGTANADPVTAYTVTATGADGTVVTATSTTTSATLTGLTNQAYTIGVVATNAMGSSASVSGGTSAAYVAPDNAPVITGATSNAYGTITVNWTAPAATSSSNPDNAAITGYSVTATDASGNVFKCSSVAATATTCTITGLANNTSYTVVVAAVNAVGTGTANATVVEKTLNATVPGAPKISSVTSSGTGIVISWTAPTVNGGLTFTGYNVTAQAADGSTISCPTVSGTATTCTIANAVPATAYTISVAAVSAAGTGTAATQSFTTAATPAPVLPTAIIVTFVKNTTTLTAAAKKSLAAFSKKINGGQIHVIINGFGKTVAIARARAIAVATYLVSTGADVRVSVQANTGTTLNAVSVSPATA